MRAPSTVLTLWMLAGCAGQNPIDQQDAADHLVGSSDAKILACMGKPQGRYTVGTTEVWQYNAGGLIVGKANVQGKSEKGSVAPAAGPRYCIVNIAIGNKAVQSVNYSSLTGAAVQSQECVAAIRACLPR
jgi:hypothetical protein